MNGCQDVMMRQSDPTQSWGAGGRDNNYSYVFLLLHSPEEISDILHVFYFNRSPTMRWN